MKASDKRLKTDIEPLHYGLHEIMALKPKEYDFHLGKSIAGPPKMVGRGSQTTSRFEGRK